MPVCAGHLGRPPWPPATVPTPGVQPGWGQRRAPVPQRELGPLGGQGCRWVEGAGMRCMPPVPKTPGWGSYCPSSPCSRCPPVVPSPSRCRRLLRPVWLHPQHWSVAEPTADPCWRAQPGAQNAAVSGWELARHPPAPVGDTGRGDAGSTGLPWVGRLPWPRG